MPRTQLLGASILCLMLALTGCDDGSPAGDAGPPLTDAGPTPVDAGAPPLRCDEVTAGADAVPLEATTGDSTLSGVYRVTGRVVFDAGQTTEIAPGTVFLMDTDAHVIFGWRGDPSTIHMNGTAEAPILFCGVDPTAGSWKGVELATGVQPGSSLSHVVIEHAGGAGHPAALTIQREVVVQHLQIHDATAVGVRVEALGEGSDDFVVDGTTLAAQLVGDQAIDRFPAGSYTGNERDLVEVSELTGGFTVHDRGVPYLQTRDREVLSAGVVTFEAGVEYRFAQDAFLSVGLGCDEVTLEVRGTADAPVVFTSHRDGDGAAPGDWRGVNLECGARTDSVIEHAVFRFGGRAPGGDDTCVGNGDCANLYVALAGNLALRDSTFTESAGYGIYVSRPTVNGVTINGDATIAAALDAAGNTLTGNAAGPLYLDDF